METMMHTRYRILLLLTVPFALLWWFNGCESPAQRRSVTRGGGRSPAPSEARSPTATTTTSLPRVLPSQIAQPPTEPTSYQTPSKLLGLEPGQWVYRIIAGDDEGQMLGRYVRKVDDPHAPWRVHMVGPRIEHLTIGEHGSVMLVAVKDLEHNVVTRYHPPIPVIPARIEPGQTRRYTTKLTVHPLDNPDSISHRGSGVFTITYEARQKISTPAGDFRAYRFHSTWVADLGIAEIDREDWRWYVPGVGLVAAKLEEHVQAFILGWDTQRVMLLQSAHEQ